MSQPLFTKGPWTICWQTYNGRRTNFHITASPYGSVRPLARSDWKIEWSEVEGDELVANANLMGASPELYDAAVDALKALTASTIGTIRMDDPDWYGEVDAAVSKLRSALAKAEGRG